MIHALALAATVHIRNFAYSHATVTVVAGQRVRFVNDDQDAHTVTSTTKAFDSGGLDTGDAWTYVFAKPGRYAYFCALHPYMRGMVVVARKRAAR
jgi:plastocyanin